MSNKTSIEWTDATWNPVTGCTKVSAGCKHCYAEREWPRMTRLVPSYAGRDFTDVRCHPERLDQPLRWKRPRKVFVNSMSDLFHEDVPDWFVDSVFAVMSIAETHTFQVLTKRPHLMRTYLSDPHRVGKIMVAATALNGDIDPSAICAVWPLPNVWLGTSVEDQPSADKRVVELLETPAAVRFISAEPLLGSVNVGIYLSRTNMPGLSMMPGFVDPLPGIDWVIVGGESGPNARPMHPDWVRSLRDQCAAAGVPFLFKQWGEWIGADQDECPVGPPASRWQWGDGTPFSYGGIGGSLPLLCRAGKARAGRLLDGVLHDGHPG